MRLLSYNVHGCVGGDRRLDLARIVEVIAAAQPDVVALQELDVGRLRSGGIDQAEEIAAALEMTSVFHPAMHVAEEKYGDAILTSLPMRVVKTGPIPSRGEPRGAIWCEIEHGARPLHVFNTHLGLWRGERLAQVRTLLGPAWLGHPECRGQDTVLMGDFNSVPSSPSFAQVASVLQLARPRTGRLAGPTFPARLPLLRLDHIFLSKGLRCLDCTPLRTPPARLASDHLPLLAVLERK
ncbi:endonuclease/exonuclease/phosphatase family protein [Stappia sp. WLB 29]|uniref:endonuclease/exonuclease/phosphatase family protein n=1 Tax=Stappia sp. WLB 29 TaxID=2925220 RepID=UPI0020C0A133|nr:endonuclease/exonuclease/phosphatase family protein [Stappia sp. WLB 29]